MQCSTCLGPLTFEVDYDPELVDEHHLETWLEIGGRRIGICDWRPERSGQFGRFALRSMEKVGS